MIRVPLSGNKGVGKYAIIDDDCDWVLEYNWCFSNGNAVCTNSSNRSMYMSRVVLDAPDGSTVYHINGDKLDNRRDNLRLLTAQEKNKNKICKVKGCKKDSIAKGYCSLHYNRWRSHGDPEAELSYIRGNMIKDHPNEYRSWQSMNTRCNNPNRQDYPRYGGRSIKVCDRWAERPYGFRNFYEDMGDRPKDATLDRIDPDGDYCPENCRWADAYTQSSNRRYVGYLYIYFDKRNGRFYVRVKRKKNIYNGAFSTLEEAIVARNDALKLFGLEDLLNKIEKGEMVCH